jgi:hypothetical protein
MAENTPEDSCAPVPEPEKPTASAPAEPTLTPNQQAIEDISWDFPFVRVVWNFFIREGKAVKNGWVAVSIIVLIAVYLTRSCTKGDIDSKISDITNSFNGKISAFKGQLTDAKQDRDKYQVMLAPFEAMAIAKYTNVPIEQSIDLLFADMTSKITNMLSAAEYPQANFLFSFNDTNLISSESDPNKVVAINNFITINDRKIRLNIMNPSKNAGINAFVIFSALIDPTNIIADGWYTQPKSSNGFNNWRYDVNHSIPQDVSWHISTIEISTNFNNDTLLIRFLVGSDNSVTKQYIVSCVLAK